MKLNEISFCVVINTIKSELENGGYGHDIYMYYWNCNLRTEDVNLVNGLVICLLFCSIWIPKWNLHFNEYMLSKVTSSLFLGKKMCDFITYSWKMQSAYLNSTTTKISSNYSLLTAKWTFLIKLTKLRNLFHKICL